MSHVASGIASLLNILYAPLVYAVVLQVWYHTDPISVLLEGPVGWLHYSYAAFVALIVTMFLVALTMRGGSRAIGHL